MTFDNVITVASERYEGFEICSNARRAYINWADDHFCFDHSSKDGSRWGALLPL